MSSKQELAKTARGLGEDGKVAIRNIRKDSLNKLKKMGKVRARLPVPRDTKSPCHRSSAHGSSDEGCECPAPGLSAKVEKGSHLWRFSSGYRPGTVKVSTMRLLIKHRLASTKGGKGEAASSAGTPELFAADARSS